MKEGVGEAVFCKVAAAFYESECCQEQPDGEEDAELSQSARAYEEDLQ